MRTSLFVILFLIISKLSFSQLGVGNHFSFGENVELLNLSLKTNLSSNYGIVLRQGFGYNAPYYNRNETNLIFTRSFFNTDYSNFYVGVGGLLLHQKYESKQYFDWGFSIPLGVEIFPNPEQRRIGIAVESGLFFKTFKQRGIMERDEDKFGGYGGLSIHYYFGKKK
jgi:hypothetical protein